MFCLPCVFCNDSINTFNFIGFFSPFLSFARSKFLSAFDPYYPISLISQMNGIFPQLTASSPRCRIYGATGSCSTRSSPSAHSPSRNIVIQTYWPLSYWGILPPNSPPPAIMIRVNQCVLIWINLITSFSLTQGTSY